MEFNLKRLLSFVVALVMVLSMVPFNGLQVFAAEGDETQTETVAYTRPTSSDPEIDAIMLAADEVRTASKTAYTDGKCPICGDVTWTTLPTTGSTSVTDSASKHFYVPAGTYTNSGTTKGYALLYVSAAAANVCVLFSGDVTNAGRLIYVNGAGSKLNVFSDGTASIYSTGLGGQNGMIEMQAENVEVNLYGGTFVRENTLAETATTQRVLIYQPKTTGEVNIYNDTVIGPETRPSKLCINTRMYAKLNMYGGTIRNGNALVDWKSGNVWMLGAKSEFNMYAGTVSGGRAKYGANIYVGVDSHVNIGGTVTGGTATVTGGNITAYGGHVVINGTVSNGTAPNGGNICLGMSTTYAPSITINKGAEISGGNATTSGGNVYMVAGTFESKAGATIKNGYAGDFGGNLYLANNTSTVGGSVYGGTTEDPFLHGGNIAMFGGDVTITGTVGNDAVVHNGENVYAEAYIKYTSGKATAYAPGVLTLDGAQLLYKEGVVDGSDYLGKGLDFRRDITIPTDETLKAQAEAATMKLVLKNNTNCNRILAIGTNSSTVYGATNVEIDPSFSGEVEVYYTGDKYVCGTEAPRNLIGTGTFSGDFFIKSNGQTPSKLAVKYDTELSKLTIPHVFDEKVADDAHLVAGTGADCQNLKHYYFDCANCDTMGETSYASETYGDHSMDTEWTTEDGKHFHKCLITDCDHIEDEATCEYTNLVKSQDATCTEDGYEIYTCVCGAENTVTLTAPGHDLTHYAAVPADHYKDGNIEYWYCETCKVFFSDAEATTQVAEKDTVIDMIPHEHSTDWTQGETQHWNECSCGDKINIADHEYDNACDTACNVCGKTREITHDYQAVVTDPDCENDGYTTYTCSVCNHTYTGDVVKTEGHSYEAVVTPPNCVDAGYTTHTCSVCGDDYTDTPVEALGHDYQATVIDPTEDVAGYTQYQCSRCSASYTDNVVPALGKLYTVTFVVPNGVECVVSQEIYGNHPEALPTPEYTGYTFYGWATSAFGEIETAPTNMVTLVDGKYDADADVTLYAVYKSEKSGAAAGEYVKVTSAPTDWSGEYLIVYEDASIAFDGGLSALDAINNTIDVTITDGKIAQTDATTAAQFTIAAMTGGYSIQSASGSYIGRSATSNGLDSKSAAVANTIAMNDDGTPKISGTGGPSLRFNDASNQMRFRYYKNNGQKAIALYKLVAGQAQTETKYITATENTVSFKTPADVTAPGNVTAVTGSVLDLPNLENITLSGVEYTFAGWTEASVEDTVVVPTVYNEDYVLEADITLYAVYTYTKTEEASDEYVLTDIGDIKNTDLVVITEKKDGAVYALTSAKGTGAAPTAVSVTVSGNKLSGTPAADLLWNIDNNGGNLTIYVNGTTSTWLYCTSTNNGVRVGTNSANTFVIDTNSGYLKHTGTNRYVGIYFNQTSGDAQDWRCYTSTTTNIADQTLGFYVKSTGGLTTYYTSNPTADPCANGHTEGEVVVENKVDATCTTEGSYDNVIYCTVCDEELDRETITVPVIPHTEGEVVVENEVAATCTTEGSYDNVIYCTVCDEELDRETITVPVIPHTPVEIPAVAPTFDAVGYTSGVKCDVCGEILTAPTEIPALIAVAKVGDDRFETLAAAVEAAGDGETVTLLDNATGAGVVFAKNKNVVIDLNGKTYTLNESVGSSAQYGTVGFYQWAGGNVTIKNGTINMVPDENGDSVTFFKMFHTYGNMTLTDVTLDCANGVWWNGSTDVGFVAVESDNGSLTIDGSSSIINADLSAETWSVVAYRTGKVTIDTTGTIEGVIASYSSTASVELKNGTFIENNASYDQLTSISSGKIAVSGGSYTEPVTESFCAEGFIPQANDDGTYGVKVGKFVAQVGTEKFESLADAIAAADENDTIVVLENIDLTEGVTVAADKVITLDLNGKTVSMVRDGALSAYDQLIDNYGTLTVTDTSAEANGELKYQYVGPTVSTGFAAVTIVNRDGATLTIAGGTVNNCTTTGHTAYAIDNISYSKVTTLNITGGTVTSVKGENRGLAVRACVNGTQSGSNVVNISGGTITGGYAGFQVFNISSNDAPADINITGGTINGGSYGMYTSFMGADVSSVDIDISGGIFNAPYALFIYNGKADSAAEDKVFKANISGGTFNGEIWIYAMDAEGGYAYQPAVSGGTFAVPVYEVYCADGFIPVSEPDADGMYTVKEGVYVARNSTTGIGYETLADAIAAASNGDTIVVLVDIEVADSVVVDKNVTIDLNGKTVSAASTLSSKPVIRVLGNVTVTGGTVDGTTGINSYAFIVGNNAVAGTLNIADGNYKGITSAISVTQGVAYISGGTFSTAHDGEGTDYGAYYLLNLMDNSASSIVVTGGTFVGFNPEENKSENPAVDFTADGYIGVEDGNGNYIVRQGVWVAKVGEKKFESLADAFANAAKGDTVTLLTNVTLTEGISVMNSEVLADLTIDGAGYTITLDMNGAGTGLKFGGEWATGIKIKDLTITGSANYALWLNGGTTSELTNVTISGDYDDVYGALILYGTHGATLTNCDIVSGFVNGQDDYPLNLVNTKIGYLLANNSQAEEDAVKVFVDENSYIAELLCGGNSTEMIDDNAFAYIGSYTTEAGDVVAEAVVDGNTVRFATLQAAVAAVEAGDTIVVIADHKVADSVIVDKNVTIDLNGKTVSAASTLSSKPVIRVLGNVTVTGGTVDGTTGINSYAFIVGNNAVAGTLNIADGNYKGITSAISVTQGVAYISGGTFSTAHDGEGTDYGAYYLLNLMDNSASSIVVTGGTFVGFNPKENKAENPAVNFCAPGYWGVDDGTGTYTVELNPNVTAWNSDSKVEYETVEEALAAAKSGETVELLADSTANAFFVMNGVTLDLNGYKLTANMIATMPGAYIVDDSADSSGVLVIPENAFVYNKNNPQLILKTSEGYRFVEAAMMQALQTEGNGYKFWVGMDRNSDMLLAQLINQYGAANLHIQFRTIVSWENDRGYTEQKFSFKDQLVDEFIAACCADGEYSKAVWMTILNAEDLTNLAFTARLVIMDANGNELQTIDGQTVYASSIS